MAALLSSQFEQHYGHHVRDVFKLLGALSHIRARLSKMAFERVWENNSRSLSPKAKSTNYMPARTSKKVEILLQEKTFEGRLC